ncbi:S1C family serine protease [Aminipila sp.]|uniref:S1C family serine protease n=1 Tax=Aminipila sp. TaxID=2060095 RepID=UPI00289CF4DC|nr:trypsin-like peptidase domain-containing protein [Aminipila sp.]
MELKINLNNKRIESLDEFKNCCNRCNNMEKDTVYVIQNGTNDVTKLMKAIKDADLELTDYEEKKSQGYYRTDRLDSFIEADKKEVYLSLYNEWVNTKDKDSYFEMKFPFNFENNLWDITYKQAFLQITEEFFQEMSTIVKLRNFVVIMFNWIDLYFPRIFSTTKTLSRFPKFVYVGPIRTNEFLFLKLLALCGCDVYCINPFKQLDIKLDNITFGAQLLNENEEINTKIPIYNKEQILSKFHRNMHIEKNNNEVCATRAISGSQMQETEKSLEYEELAQMASSVVLITVLDENKNPFASGSGVLINNNGYILTNFHVIAGGSEFAIRLEEEEQIRYTTELIKYHSSNDLALLRIEPVNRKPIPLYSGNKLVRGQKVVAIGSPLGLFNTVSDGIIAGFREFDQRSMIQFTAPISHGSSGGALLNLHGQLVGIVTAGFDDGQNLNLAVDYETAATFLRGFL